MTAVFAKLGLRDYIRRHVCYIPKEAADGLVIPPGTVTMAPPSKAEPVWYFVLAFLGHSDNRHTALIYPIQRFSEDENNSRSRLYKRRHRDTFSDSTYQEFRTKSLRFRVSVRAGTRTTPMSSELLISLPVTNMNDFS